MTEKRYERNIGTITLQENEKLKRCRVCVIGCGGLGGYVIEELSRMGVGHITAVDGDAFQISNLNRQILSSESVLGQAKALAAKERVEAINSHVELVPVCCYITDDNASEILSKGYDAVVDALDNITGRRILEKHCKEQNLPLIHGAIAGWHGQVAVIMPGDELFRQLYPSEASDKGAETETGNPSFTPAVTASIQTAEVIKVLLSRPQILRNKLLTIDLLEQEYEVIQL